MYRKDGLPEVGEFVVVTIKSTSQHSADFDLDEFKDLTGTVTSSEMSRKWARNIRIFLKPGRKMVCKVMKVDEATHHIDLSIKRVGLSQSQTKQKEWNNEKRADELFVALSKSLDSKYEDIFKKIGKPILDNYGLVYPFLLEMLDDGTLVKELKLDSKLEESFVEIVQKRIKKRKARITGLLNMKSYAPDGLDVIKKALKDIRKFVEEDGDEIEIKYLGAPKYKIVYESADLKHGENKLMDVLQRIEKHIKKQNGSLEFKKSTT